MGVDHKEALILWFNEIGIEDVPLVGGKNASLGEMYQQLIPKGVNIPDGFAITAYAYQHLIKSAGIEDDFVLETFFDLLVGEKEKLTRHRMGNRLNDIVKGN